MQRWCLFLLLFSPKLLKLQERVLRDVVIGLLGDEDPRVRHVAATSLMRYLSASVLCAPLLVTALNVTGGEKGQLRGCRVGFPHLWRSSSTALKTLKKKLCTSIRVQNDSENNKILTFCKSDACSFSGLWHVGNSTKKEIKITFSSTTWRSHCMSCVRVSVSKLGQNVHGIL